MEMKNIEVRTIDAIQHLDKVVGLLRQLNPEMDADYLESTQKRMSALPNYNCFGLFDDGELIGISSGWNTIRIYCGKQLELDNVIIESSLQSKGLGKFFLNEIKKWCSANEYLSIGLNTYVQNSRSHKFYFNEGFKILGFHFEQRL